MTAVTLSPHQLANLQHQHQGLPVANNPSRTRTPTTHVTRAATFHLSEHAGERPDSMEVSAGRLENREYKTPDQTGPKVPSDSHPQDVIQQSSINLGNRSNVQQSSGAQDSSSSSPAAENQTQQGPKETISGHEISRLKTTSGANNDELATAHLVEAPRENTEVEAVAIRGINGYGRRKQLPRAKSDLGARGPSPTGVDTTTEEENWELRHGWDDQYNSSEYLSILSSVSRHMHRRLVRGAKRTTKTVRASTKSFVS